MATKKTTKAADKVVEPSGAAPGEREVSVEELEARFLKVKAMQEAAFEASAKQGKWNMDHTFAARELERLGGVLAQDKGAILAWFNAAEQAALEDSFTQLLLLAQAGPFIAEREAWAVRDRALLTAAQYKAAHAKVLVDRALLFEQAPMWVKLKVLTPGAWAHVQQGRGPLDRAMDVDSLAGEGVSQWSKLAPLQELLDKGERLTKEQLEAAQANAQALIAHIGRVDTTSPDLKKVDWARHAAANRYLLKLHWERVCDAAAYHYKRSGQAALIRERCVPLGALRKKG